LNGAIQAPDNVRKQRAVSAATRNEIFRSAVDLRQLCRMGETLSETNCTNSHEFRWLSRIFQIPVIVALLGSGCGALHISSQPSGLPLRYHQTQYGLTFFLPASWQGYSVLIQQWNAPLYSADNQRVAGTERGPIIVFRNAQWKKDGPYQDIPIMVFTRSRWDALHSGKFFPYAGGVMGEMCHNHQYVFGIYSRYNADDSVKGWKEADDILQRNCALYTTPPLYPE